MSTEGASGGAGAAAIRALTIDLDDTLWPIGPTIVRAEHELFEWLREHAPNTAQQLGPQGLLRLRQQVMQQHPERGHDFTWLRRTAIERALQAAGDPTGLVDPAFEVFFHWRQQVTPFDDVLPALTRLAARYPLFVLTNGNAEWRHMPLGAHFVGGLTAREHGAGKPSAGFFHAACASLGFAPEQVLHVGDDWQLDIVGAHGAGLPAAWIHRPGLSNPFHPPAARNPADQPAWFEGESLGALAAALGT